jgi:phage shock protein PspC (stress-responsive transcriptional regulator)
VAGVAGGLADYYQTRPIWFRLLFGASALSSVAVLWESLDDASREIGVGEFGLGAILALLALAATATYFLLWWLVPREDLPESSAQRISRHYPSARRWPGIALLGIGAAILLNGLGVWRGNVVIAAALIAAGVLLYRRDGVTVAEVGATTPRSATPPAIPGSAPPTAPAPGPEDPGVARFLPPRERSALGWTTLGVALLVVGGAVIWVNATDATPRLVTIPALALLVISAGLLVGTFVGRARWLILPALLLLPVVLLASVVRLPLEGEFGDLDLRPGTVAEVGGPYRVTAGGISIDLTRFQEQDVDVSVEASTVFGEIWVIVPYDAHVIANARTGYGNVQIAEAGYDSGLEVAVAARSEPRWGDGMTVRLVLESGIGSVNVYRDYPSRRELREIKQERRAASNDAANEGSP